MTTSKITSTIQTLRNMTPTRPLDAAGARQIAKLQASHFAATLLMPKAWLTQLWGEGVQDLQALADAFDVSTMAMRRRLVLQP